jgi:hypothetical protein
LGELSTNTGHAFLHLHTYIDPPFPTAHTDLFSWKKMSWYANQEETPRPTSSRKLPTKGILSTLLMTPAVAHTPMKAAMVMAMAAGFSSVSAHFSWKIQSHAQDLEV